jgi:hypothetical protein
MADTKPTLILSEPKPRLIVLFVDLHNRTLARQWAIDGHDAARQSVLMIAGRGDLMDGDTLTIRSVVEGAAILNEHRETD